MILPLLAGAAAAVADRDGGEAQHLAEIEEGEQLLHLEFAEQGREPRESSERRRPSVVRKTET